MKVCHLISGDLWAGAEVMVFQLLKRLKTFPDMELSAVFLNEGRPASAVRNLGIPVQVIPENTLSFINILQELKVFLKCDPPDIIHSHRYKENILAFLSSRQAKNMKLISTQHGLPEPMGRGFSLRNFIAMKANFWILAKAFEALAVVSEDIGHTLLGQRKLPKAKLTMIHNGIEIPENINPPKNKGTWVIGSSGRLSPVKNFSLMIEIARDVLRKRNDVRFELAGEGPERENLESKIRKYGLEDSFHLRGFISDMGDFYQNLDLFLSTSIHEGIPYSALEAMSFGVPIVAPNVGGFREILENGIQGYLVNEKRPLSFSLKCLNILENQEIRQKMNLEARQRILKRFSAGQMARRYYDLYKRAIIVP